MNSFVRIAGILAASAALMNTSVAYSAIKPGSLFTDNAVLQEQSPIPVWGMADPSEPITVVFNGQTVKTVADPSGAWSVKLSPNPAGGPYKLEISGSAGDKVTLNNILVGEVWVCGGQSNMEYPLIGLTPPVLTSAAIPTATDPLIHFANIAKTVGIEPQPFVNCSWQVAQPDTVPRLSAIGYFFARDLRKALGVPIGLINDNWGGTPAEAWTSKEALQAVPELQHYVATEAQYKDNYPQMLDQYNAELTQFQAAAAAANASGDQSALNALKAPSKPSPYERWNVGAAHLFNGMIAPIIPYGIRGVIWYQGEANGAHGYEYKTLFPTMIADWRARWGEGNFPFLYVQLAPFFPIKNMPLPPGKNTWADLREAQRLTLAASPNTGMAVITDLGDSKTVHPRRKELVGDRLALIARALVYKENTEYSGPVFVGAAIDGSRIRVTFSHATGLRSIDVHDFADDGPLIAHADTLTGFEVAGADEVYYSADAVIDGNSVIVSSSKVPSPVAVRYGWADYPIANLVNEAGLPASPFKSDNWTWASATPVTVSTK